MYRNWDFCSSLALQLRRRPRHPRAQHHIIKPPSAPMCDDTDAAAAQLALPQQLQNRRAVEFYVRNDACANHLHVEPRVARNSVRLRGHGVTHTLDELVDLHDAGWREHDLEILAAVQARVLVVVDQPDEVARSA